VAVASIEIGAEIVQRERNVTGRMRAIHDGDDASLSRAANEFWHRQDQRRRRGNMADDEDTCALRHARPDLLHHLRVAARRQADRLRAIDRANLLGEKAPRALDRAVLVICSQDLVTRP
jgi:hypothetical protein